jgi:RNA 3'-terminal phosphate cyclase (ATP)
MAATISVANMTDSKLENIKIGSKEFTIKPGDINGIKTEYKCDCNGAGSIGLLIQQILPCVIFGPNETHVEMIGGTIVSHAPPTYYLDDVLKIILKEKIGIDFSIQVKKHGLYPTGGGIVNFKSFPVTGIVPIDLTTRGKLNKIKLRVISTGNFNNYVQTEALIKEIFKEMKKIIFSYLKKIHPDDENLLNADFEIEKVIQFEKDLQKVETFKNKKVYTLFAQIVMTFENTIISVEQLYSEKAEKPELKEFANEFLKKFENTINNENVCLDEFTVDHLIIFMALAKGRSKVHIGEISKHTLTAVEVIKTFVPDIKIQFTSYENYNCLELEGIAWKNENKI